MYVDYKEFAADLNKMYLKKYLESICPSKDPAQPADV